MRRYLGACALLVIVGITVAWWALALWPTSAVTPQWLLRTRLACFGDGGNGLPSSTGWLVLIGQPASMFMFLFAVWGSDVVRSLRAVWATSSGRALGVITTFGVSVCITAATIRVIGPHALAGAPVSGTAPQRVSRVPPLALIDQHGARIDLADFRGHPVVVAFAYAHCETVCPLIVHDVSSALAQTATREPIGLIVTVDPWRDTPARLPAIARTWRLSPSAHVLSGSVAEVNEVLSTWEVGIVRDPGTGEVSHGASVYIIARDGRSAYVLPATTAGLAALLQTL